MENFLKAIEDYLMVPYVWEIFRIVILPNSFPYGGMENPVLTFASPVFFYLLLNFRLLLLVINLR